ncbi:sigma factor [Arthrobacter sp. H14]|uniref:sigma factor n=1 Tax=Arthrobacter sp. H14 TaxID=1312959 RepID=UPI003FA43955
MTRVYGTVRRVLLDRTLSEDATQDVYVQVWFTAHKYNPDVGSPMTWLLMIGHRRAVDRVRAEQRFFGRNTKYEAQSWPGEQDPVPELVDRLVAGEAIGRCLG